MRTEAELVANYRRRNPRSRAVGLLKFVRNSERVKQQGCILCGARGPTWCGLWWKTVRAREWASEHRARHLDLRQQLLDEVVRLDVAVGGFSVP